MPLSHRSSKQPNRGSNSAFHQPRGRLAAARKAPKRPKSGQKSSLPELVAGPLGTPFCWDDIHYFLELARRGRLLATARRLSVAHTTVLRRIATLEKSLDRKLFKRSDAGLILTDAGLELLNYAETMEGAAHAIAKHAGERNRPAGPVRVAMMEGLASTFFGPRILDFQSINPGIVIELVTLLQIANLSKREADISIGFVRPTGARLVTRRVSGSSVHLYAADTYLARNGKPKTVAELAKHQFVDYIDDIVFLPQLRWFRDSVDQKSVVFRSSSPMAQLAAVKNGVGIGMFPDYMVEGAGLRSVLPDKISDERELWLTTHEELRNVPRVRAVFDYIRELFVQQRAYLEGRSSEVKRPLRPHAGAGWQQTGIHKNDA
jgi:DNA-binding transcriptional LysR family regulator